MAGNVVKGKVVIDVAGIKENLDQVSDSLDKLGTESKASGQNIGSLDAVFNTLKLQITELQGQLDKLAPKSKNAGDAIEDIKPGLKEANEAFLELGKGIQKSPESFREIVKEVRPFIKALKELKESTGSTKGALASLIESFKGPGGITIAVSLAVAGLVQLAKSLFESKKETKELDDENKKLAQNITSDLSKLTVLVGIIQNVSTSTEERAKALKALNQQYGKYLDALGKEDITLSNVAESYDRIVDALLKQAVVKGLQDQISKKIEETAAQIINLQKATLERKVGEENTQGVIRKGTNLQDIVTKKLNDNTRAVSDNTNQVRNSFAVRQAFINQETDATDPIADLTAKLKLQLDPLLKLTTSVEDLGISLSETGKKAEKGLDPFNKTGILKEGAIKLPVTVDFSFLKPQASPEQVEQLSQFFKGFQVPVQLKFVNAIKVQAIRDILDGIRKTIEEDLTGAFNTFIDSVSQGANAFQAFGQLIKNVIKSIIVDLIKAVALAAILSAISGLGGGEKLSFLQALAKSFGGFRAGGGPVSSSRGYIVGENGPEYFLPSTSGTIIPNGGSIGALSGVAGGLGDVRFRIGFRELVAAMAMGDQSQSRLV